MPSAVARDRLAEKIAALPSVDHAYGNGSVLPDIVAPIPAYLSENAMSAVVHRGTTARTRGTGNQWIVRVFEVEFSFPAHDLGNAEQIIDDLEDEILTEFSEGITLGGPPYIDCIYEGGGRPVEETDERQIEWWVWTATFTVRERVSLEMTP